MKTPVSPHMVAFLFFGSMASLSAQNLASVPRPADLAEKADAFDDGDRSGFVDVSTLLVRYDVPALKKAQGHLADPKPVYVAQDALTLDDRPSGERNVESVVDLNVLRNPSPYRKVAVSGNGRVPYEISGDSMQTGLAMISAVYRVAGKTETTSDCQSIALSVEQRIRIDSSRVLEIVELEVSANPKCACEVVKVAIKASEADVELVTSIVETAIHAAPDSMRMISQCAIASMPESIAEVQALLSRLDPNSGDDSYSSKGAKGAKAAVGAKVATAVATPPDPLTLPPSTPRDPPLVYPPPVTDVNPELF